MMRPLKKASFGCALHTEFRGGLHGWDGKTRLGWCIWMAYVVQLGSAASGYLTLVSLQAILLLLNMPINFKRCRPWFGHDSLSSALLFKCVEEGL